MSDGGDMDPIILGAVAKAGEVGVKAADSAAKETGGLLSRLFGPSADVIGEGWADRLRQKNLTRVLTKTERLAAGKSDPGWAQPRVANAVFEAAQYANDEIVTDYLSGVLASSRETDGGTDDALPWSSLVSRLSALQLRIHYLYYLNLRQIVKATDERSRIYEFESSDVYMQLGEFCRALGLADDASDFQRFADAMQGLKQEDLISGYAFGNRDFFDERYGARFTMPKLRGVPQKKRVLETPFDDVLQIAFTPFGVQLFLWGLGFGAAPDTDYLDPDRVLSIQDADALVSAEPLESIGFADDFWTEYEIEDDPDEEPSGF